MKPVTTNFLSTRNKRMMHKYTIEISIYNIQESNGVDRRKTIKVTEETKGRLRYLHAKHCWCGTCRKEECPRPTFFEKAPAPQLLVGQPQLGKLSITTTTSSTVEFRLRASISICNSPDEVTYQLVLESHVCAAKEGCCRERHEEL